MSDIEVLSKRERQVFELIADGVGPSDIASRLCLSVKTISTYRARIMEKLGARSNAALATLRAQERLDVAADHTLVAAAICAGIARWDPIESTPAGELIVAGLRYWTVVDDAGVPTLNDILRAELRKHLERSRTAMPRASATNSTRPGA